VQGIRQGRTR